MNANQLAKAAASAAASGASSASPSTANSATNTPLKSTIEGVSSVSTRFARVTSIKKKDNCNRSRTRKPIASSSSSSSSQRTAHDLPPIRVRAIPPSLIMNAEYFSNQEQVYMPLELKPNQCQPTKKELKRFLKEIQHPFEYLDQPIRSQSMYDELHAIFLDATSLPNDLIRLIREYRLEIHPSQSLLVSAKFGPHHPDSRPFNTASIAVSYANVVNEHNRFRDEMEFFRTYSKERWLSAMHRQRALKARHRVFIGPEVPPTPVASSVSSSVTTVPVSISQPEIVHSLSTLLYSGYSIREIIGYYGRVNKVGPSCFGVKFVYGSQIEPDSGNTESSMQESLAQRYDLGFVMSSSVPSDCGYQRSHWRLQVDEYITRVTLQIGRYHFAVAVIFETNLNRKFHVGPESDDDGRTHASEVTVEYVIDTPPDHALIALTGTEGEHVHAIRCVYAAIKKPSKQPVDHA